MANLTPFLTELLSKHNSHTLQSPSEPKDEFLKEAYRINTHLTSLTHYLRSIRPAYLSTAPPPARLHPPPNPKPSSRTHLTNPQRSAIDASSKTLLHDLDNSITQLDQAEKVRQQVAFQVARKTQRRGLLLRWAEGDDSRAEEVVVGEEEKTMRIWRESVLWYLRRGLQEAGEVQRGMMEKRVQREVERNKSVLYKVKDGPGREALVREIVGGEEWRCGAGVGGVMNGGARKGGMSAVELEAEERRTAETQLSPEQLQLFKQENEDLMKRYEGQLDQIRTAEKSMTEIAQMGNHLIQTLELQSESIQQMQIDSLSTAENVGGGNKQLQKAAERKSTARMVFWATCGLCGFLVAWDLVF